ncbi:MAG: M48 family metallopeptidase [Caulobacterales bacterium]
MTYAGIQGSFVDGKTPVARTVVVRIDGPDLHMFGDGADVRWPLKKIRADDAPGQGEYFISVRGDYDARLTIKGIPPEMMALLETRAPQAFHKKTLWRKRAALVTLLATSAAGLVALAFFGVPRLADPLAEMTPPQLEARMGAGVMAEVSQNMGEPIPDPLAQSYVQQVVDRIAHSAKTNFPLRSQLIDSEISNAFALPGGYVVVTCPLILELQNPAELQAVLSHEIAHVARRHVMAGLIRNIGAQISLAVLTGGAGGGATMVKIANQAAQLSYSREAESEADHYGISYLEAQKLDASGLASFFDRMAAEKGEEENDSFVSTHPASKARANSARRKPMGPEGQSLNPDQWAHLQNICTPQ